MLFERKTPLIEAKMAPAAKASLDPQFDVAARTGHGSQTSPTSEPARASPTLLSSLISIPSGSWLALQSRQTTEVVLQALLMAVRRASQRTRC